MTGNTKERTTVIFLRYLFVKDYVDDEDQPDGFIFNRFYADCALSGTPIPWEDILDPS